MENQKKKYVAPHLTVFTYRAEVGYAGSSSRILLVCLPLYSGNQVEQYEEHEDWNDNESVFWN